MIYCHGAAMAEQKKPPNNAVNVQPQNRRGNRRSTSSLYRCSTHSDTIAESNQSELRALCIAVKRNGAPSGPEVFEQTVVLARLGTLVPFLNARIISMLKPGAVLWRKFVAGYQSVLATSPESFSAYCEAFRARWIAGR